VRRLAEKAGVHVGTFYHFNTQGELYRIRRGTKNIIHDSRIEGRKKKHVMCKEKRAGDLCANGLSALAACTLTLLRHRQNLGLGLD
jgi:hypothetical protein